MINEIRHCVTPSCKGQLVPLSVDTKCLGGAVKIYYGCDTAPVCFESSLKSESLTSSEIHNVGAAIQCSQLL